MATKEKGELREVSVVLTMEPDPEAVERARVWWEQLISGQKVTVSGKGPKEPRAPRAPREGGQSNADKVRAKIKEAKEQGKDHAWVQAWAQSELGMKEALAKTYVKNNWSKV